jgi:aldose 1-epimerase
MNQKTTATRAPFGAMPDGTAVEIFTLTNLNGLELRAINYGAIIQSLKVPDKSGQFADIVNGHDALDGYLNRSRFFGAVVGRYGNRIAKGKFTLDGTEYTLALNNGPNHLHGGVKGFDKVVWDVTKDAVKAGSREAAVTFSRLSPDGEEGYPGNLTVSVTYVLTDENELLVAYAATTDKATPINLTQHSYFNLAGHQTKDILDHRLMVNADRYTPVDETQIPTGAKAPVAGTPFDFRTATRIGARIAEDNEQLKIGAGYDHNFVLNRQGAGLALAARLGDPASGRVMEVLTTQPGLQVATANRLDGTIVGKGGATYGRHSGVCLETQHFPDSPNQPEFPSTILRPDQHFESRTVFKFSFK